ncbi:MAG: DUF1849 family protein [Dongiaceae bacterium]
MAIPAFVRAEPASPVIPHRAAYELRLATGGEAQFIDISGDMAFEWADSCDGWSVTQRTRMHFEYRAGLSIELGWSLTSWESKDGMQYRFQLKQYENGEVTEELRGDATLDAASDGAMAGGTAHYTRPEINEVILPAGTVFPTVHSLEIIAAARQGMERLWAQLFDGTTEEGLYEVGAVILPRAADLPIAEALDPALVDGHEGWRVDLAFYDHQSPDSIPTHEQTIWLFDNGIVDRMTLDYGDFQVDGILTRFEPLPEPVC